MQDDTNDKTQNPSLSPQHPPSIGYREIETLCFPTRFTAVLRYHATGEGMTTGIVLSRARDADDLRDQLRQAFGGWYAQCTEIWPGLVMNSTVEALLAPSAVKFFREGAAAPAVVHYIAMLHFNIS